MPLTFIKKTESGITLNLRIQTRARRNEIAGRHGDALKIRLTAPPVEGAANELLTLFLSEVLGVPRQNIKIIQGLTSRNKVVSVEGISIEEAISKLG